MVVNTNFGGPKLDLLSPPPCPTDTPSLAKFIAYDKEVTQPAPRTWEARGCEVEEILSHVGDFYRIANKLKDLGSTLLEGLQQQQATLQKHKGARLNAKRFLEGIPSAAASILEHEITENSRDLRQHERQIQWLEGMETSLPKLIEGLGMTRERLTGVLHGYNDNPERLAPITLRSHHH